MLALVLALLVSAPVQGWRSYTNTNFVNDMLGNDTTLYLATNGGVVELGLLPMPETRRTIVNTDGLPYNKCLCLARDSAGNLWVGTAGGGLAVIEVEAETVEVRSYRPSDIATQIRTLAWDGNRLLVGSDQGLYCIDTRGTPLDFADDDIRRFSVARNPELLSDEIISVAAFDNYWIGTNRGITEVDHNFATWTPYRQPLGDSVRSIARWQDSIMVATERGIAVKSGAAFRPVYEFGRTVEVSDLVVYGSTIYLATGEGLYVGDSAAQSRFQVVLASDCRALYLGSAIWVGLGGNEQSGWGIRYLASGQTWSSFANACIASDNVLDCAIGGDGSVYLCHGGPITQITPQGEFNMFYSPSPIPIQVRVDSRGRLWFAHFAGDGGLSVYNPADGSWQQVKWGEQSSWNIIDALGLDRSDTKWVFNGGGTVVAVDSSGQQTVFDVPGLAPPPGGLYEFAFDWNGRAWLGLTVGLVMIDYKGTLADKSDDQYRVITQGLPSPEVRTVAVDDRGRVWAGTSQGAAVWDGTSFQVFTTENTGGGLPSNNVYRIRVDDSHRVWVLTDKGLVIYDPVTTQWVDYGAGGLITNPLGIVGFYSGLDVNSGAGKVAVGTQRGLSVRDFGTKAPETAGHLRVFPNPCILDPANSDRRVVIDSLPDVVTNVRVYTLAGRPVANLGVDRALHRAVWNPQDVSTGIYLLVVISPNGSRVERVALVRP